MLVLSPSRSLPEFSSENPSPSPPWRVASSILVMATFAPQKRLAPSQIYYILLQFGRKEGKKQGLTSL